ncbi:MAG: hypothetical protein HC862_20400 [Scytonema sp. RU_4_4]|nr:hypothetical protein [Scytonema sp. RU_4_4]NJR76518.1 hypothetical protein [Scytonema sp. CRU_2_7]
MKSNLKMALFFLSLLCSVSASISAVLAQEPSQTTLSTQLSIQQKDNFDLLATKASLDKELQAFFNSKYDYWDARVLADYWGQSVQDAKARMGRKILWGRTDIAILEQFLVDARVKALQSVKRAQNPSSYKFFRESTYTYDDANALAKFWGDRSVMDAKLRIERNLILGNDEMIEQALRYARN